MIHVELSPQGTQSENPLGLSNLLSRGPFGVVNEPFGKTLFRSLLLAARSLMLKLLNLSEPFGLEVF